MRRSVREPGVTLFAAVMEAMARSISWNGVAREPFPPAAAALSTYTVLAVAAVLNQKSNAPPATPSRSPSNFVPAESRIVVVAFDAVTGTKFICSW